MAQSDELENVRAATLAVLLELADHQAKQFIGRAEPTNPAELTMLANQARGLAVTLESAAEHAAAAALVALDAAEDA